MAIMHDSLTLDGEGRELRSLEVVLRRATAKDRRSEGSSVRSTAGSGHPDQDCSPCMRRFQKVVSEATSRPPAERSLRPASPKLAIHFPVFSLGCAW